MSNLRKFLLSLVDLIAPEKKAQEPEPPAPTPIPNSEAIRAVIKLERKLRRSSKNPWTDYLDSARPFN